ncbi:unnamed protein product [Phytomonas sp. EM1]|nr:unnamed protein product [Phytomonas sp. EM1]|eukprot:CCW61329.1 unnamed protein product [Phytomonas sp. isolate EM1]
MNFHKFSHIFCFLLLSFSFRGFTSGFCLGLLLKTLYVLVYVYICSNLCISLLPYSIRGSLLASHLLILGIKISSKNIPH